MMSFYEIQWDSMGFNEILQEMSRNDEVWSKGDN